MESEKLLRETIRKIINEFEQTNQNPVEANSDVDYNLVNEVIKAFSEYGTQMDQVKLHFKVGHGIEELEVYKRGDFDSVVGTYEIPLNYNSYDVMFEGNVTIYFEMTSNPEPGVNYKGDLSSEITEISLNQIDINSRVNESIPTINLSGDATKNKKIPQDLLAKCLDIIKVMVKRQAENGL